MRTVCAGIRSSQAAAWLIMSHISSFRADGNIVIWAGWPIFAALGFCWQHKC
jgi:hypothetical protein